MNTAQNTDTTQRIALKQLIRSPLNARTSGKAACEELKASIMAHGLMQNLVVTDAGDGFFLVVAGGRRLAALNELQAEGKLPEDFAVLCRVVSGKRATELSLAENIVRLAMHPADEFEAFARLAAEGASAAAIADRFGVSARHIQQRLKLGNMAPELLKEYREEKITLEALMAFAITDDREKQLQVYASLQDWQKDSVYHIRELLTQAMVEAGSKLARFVGLDAYQAAGGATRSDLFGNETYLENPELLHALAVQKLKAAEQELKAEGWGWIEVSPERDWSVISGCGRIQPKPVNPPQELLDQKAAVEAELEEIGQALEDTESDELIDAQEDAESRLAEIDEQLESLAVYDPEEMKCAGCYVSIGHDGELYVEKGLVRRADVKRLTVPEETVAPKPKGMPETLKRDLETYRLQIAQAEIATHRQLAFTLLAFHLACGVFDHRCPLDGPDVELRRSFAKPGVPETAAGDRLEALREKLPLKWLEADGQAARFEKFRQLAGDKKLDILAYCIAMTLQPKLGPAEGSAATAYDHALALTEGDVAAYWRPTKANYLGRITRDQLLAIGREVLGEPWAGSRGKAKKGEIAEQLERAFAAPTAHGRTPEQIDKLTRWLPAGMSFALPASRQPAASDETVEAA
jgi:ParB family chromosome partitioning protein